MNHPFQPDDTIRSASILNRKQWALAGILLLALAMSMALFHPNNATAYGLTTESPPSSPLPAPDPEIYEVAPSSGVNSRPVRLNIYGEHFRTDSTAYLVPSGAHRAVRTDRIPLRSIEYIDSGNLTGMVPGNIATDIYDVVVESPTRAEQTTTALEEAYKALSADSADVDDLRSQSHFLWSDSSPLYADREARLGLKVEHFGRGQGTLEDVKVDFYINGIAEANRIGQGTIHFLAPDTLASTTPVPWTPRVGGEVTVYAVIDPANEVQESNERNNIIKRTLHVRTRTAIDNTPPVVDSVSLDDGNDIALEREIEIRTEAHDPGSPSSGLYGLRIQELHWIAGASDGAGIWAPVNISPWIRFRADDLSARVFPGREELASRTDLFSLHPSSGIRYINAWVADRAGNVSLRPGADLINMVLSPDVLVMGEVRVHRTRLAQGQCLSVTVTPISGDPDLYVWAPDGSLVQASILAGEAVDRIVTSPTMAGTYQIEIEGFTDAEFEITVERLDSCDSSRSAHDTDAVVAKPAARTVPIIPIDSEPDEEVTAPATFDEYLIFVGFILGERQRNTVNHVEIYLPTLRR